MRLFSVHSVCIHDTPTFFTPGTTGPPPVRHRQATRKQGTSTTGAKQRKRRRRAMPSARIAKGKAHRARPLKRFISTSLTGACDERRAFLVRRVACAPPGRAAHAHTHARTHAARAPTHSYTRTTKNIFRREIIFVRIYVKSGYQNLVNMQARSARLPSPILVLKKRACVEIVVCNSSLT